MRLTRRQLRRLIINEMSFMGVPNILSTEKTGREAMSLKGTDIIDKDPSIDVEKMSTPEYRKKVKNYFSSKKYSRNAEQFLGDAAFPGSNTWVVPYIGSEQSAYNTIVYGFEDVDSSDEDLLKIPGVDHFGTEVDAGNFYGGRFAMFDIEEKYLRNLKIPDVTIGQINFDNDIIFVPVATVLKRNFIPSVHMMIHASLDNNLFVDISQQEGSPINSLISAMNMLSDFDIDDPDEKSKRVEQASLTRALNAPELLGTEFDYASEVLTAVILGYKGSRENLDYPDYDKDLVFDARDEYVDLLKGKIILVAVA